MTLILTLLVAALLALGVALLWLLRDQGRDLDEALALVDRATDTAEAYLQVLREAGLVNSVDTCEHTKGGTR